MSLTAEVDLPAGASGQVRPHPAPFILCVGRDAHADELIKALRACGITVLREGSLGAQRQSPASGVEFARYVVDRFGVSDAGPAIGMAVRWDDFTPLVVPPSSAGTTAHPPEAEFRWHTLIGPALPGLRYVHVLRREEAALRSTTAGLVPRRRAAAHNHRAGESHPAGWAAVLRAEDWNWIGFFTWARIQPLTVACEDFAADPAGTLDLVLRFLGVRSPAPEPSAERVLRPTAARPRARVASLQNGAVARSGPAPPVSIVVVSHNEGAKLPLTVSGIRATVPDDVDIVVVDDWSTDRSSQGLDRLGARVVQPPSRSGVAGARNWGAAQARGDLLVFADAHINPSPGWMEALRAAFADQSVACAAPTITAIGRPGSRGHGCTWATPMLGMRWLRTQTAAAHEVPFICGCLMAFRRDDFEAVGGFDTGMVCWGSEDAEIGLSLWRRGRASVVVPEAQVAHLFRPRGPYPVEPHLVVHNTLRMATVHLPELAMRRVIEAYRGLPSFPSGYAQLVESDVWQRRESVAARSRHDGAWFLDRFRIEALR